MRAQTALINSIIKRIFMARNTQTSLLPKNHSSLTSPFSPPAITTRQISDLSSVKADVSIEAVANYFGGNGYTPTQAIRNRIRHCIDSAAELVDPKATYTLFPITSIIGSKAVTLGNGIQLSLPECSADPGARLIAAIIGTLGGRLEKHCQNLAGTGKIYESTLFDAIGTAMLDLLSENICTVLEEVGKQYGLVGGPRFAPGIDGYPLEQQYQLFQMADSTSVGVVLNSSAIMMPTKSISFFMPLTQTISKNKKRNKCNVCRLRNCQFRRLPEKENL